MVRTAKTRRAGGATGFLGLSFSGDNPKHKSRPPISQAANNPTVTRWVRLQYLARLGPKPLFHFLDEVERGEPLRPHLERYAALSAGFIKANSGDQFAPAIHIVDGAEAFLRAPP